MIALPDNVFAANPAPGGGRRRSGCCPNASTTPTCWTAAPAAACVLGIDEDGLEPVALDLAGQHLMVFGEPGCGKTAVLRLLCHEIARTVPDGLVVPLDPRQTLPNSAVPVCARCRGSSTRLRGRVHGGGSGDPPIHVVVDDYDLAASALAPLADVLPHARDVGLHLFIARRSGGAARALYDPVLSAAARNRGGGVADEWQPGRRAAGGRGASETASARPRRAGDPRRPRTDHPGGVDGIGGVPMTVVCEVGPGVVRILQPGPGPPPIRRLPKRFSTPAGSHWPFSTTGRWPPQRCGARCSSRCSTVPARRSWYTRPGGRRGGWPPWPMPPAAWSTP